MYRTVVLVVLVAVAGCAGAGGGAGTPTETPPIRATAAPATLAPAVAEATGYARRRADAPPLNTTVTARIEGDVTLQTTRRVRARTARRVYVRETSAGPAVVGLYAVPAVNPFENADLRKNPAAGLSPPTLAIRAQTVYADVRDVSQSGERSVAMLGNGTTLTTYRATATDDGGSRAVAVAVATVAHGGDYVTIVVVTPAGRTAPLDRLLGAVRHRKG